MPLKTIIKRVKHYQNTPVTVITSGATGQVTLVDAIAEGATRSNSFDVYEGSTIESIYVEFWISGITLDKTATWVIVKRPANVAQPDFTDMANLGAYSNKKNIFNAGQGIPPTNGNVMNIYKGWLKIPKGKQRFGLDDKLQLVVSAVGTNVNLCGLTTFKELS